MTGTLSLTTAKQQLTVEFYWERDRYVHRVTNAAGEQLVSVDGTPNDAWPASPPIQQLSLEAIDGQAVLLGVGAAGSGHWSISVTSVSDGDDEAFKFELACRSRDQPVRLASTYRYQPAPHGSDATTLGVQAQAGVAGVTNDAGEVQLTAELDGSERTHQWAYLVCSGAGPK